MVLQEINKLNKKLSVILPLLNEKQRRLLVGAEAVSGGIKILADITGISCLTIRRGIND